MMRDDVAPRLRALGWKGSGRRFQLPDPENWIQLGFELSRRNTAAEAYFTLNVSVISRSTWTVFQADRPTLPSRPNPSVVYGRDLRPMRIGSLIYPDAGDDTWWCVTDRTPAKHVGWIANGIVDVVTRLAMPKISQVTGRIDEATVG
jgi:hypothetical protein